MPTLNTNLLPNESGLDLGSPDQQWDGFFDSIIVNNLTENGVPIITGNATELQGTPISATPPTAGQILMFNGTDWIPSSTVNATQIQGYPVIAGAPTINQALIGNGSAWAPANQSGGGGGGATLGYVAVGFSATPAFTPSPVGSCTFAMTLTGNVTSSTFTTAGLTAGALFRFYIKQDSTGNRTFQWPSVCIVKPSIGSTQNQTTVQGYIFDGTNLQPDGMAVSYP